MRHLPALLALTLLASCGSASGATGGDDLTPVVPSPVQTSAYDGHYRLLPDESFGALRQMASGPQGQAVLDHMSDMWADLRIQHGVLHSGKQLVQEFSFQSATPGPDGLDGSATWHEDIGDPGDMSQVELSLHPAGDRLLVTFVDGDAPDSIWYQRER